MIGEGNTSGNAGSRPPWMPWWRRPAIEKAVNAMGLGSIAFELRTGLDAGKGTGVHRRVCLHLRQQGGPQPPRIGDMNHLERDNWSSSSSPCQLRGLPKRSVPSPALSRALYFDVNLSKNRRLVLRRHSPGLRFYRSARQRQWQKCGPSVTMDTRCRIRNAPTASYAAFSLTSTATIRDSMSAASFSTGAGPRRSGHGGPPLNPIEMGMPRQGRRGRPAEGERRLRDSIQIVLWGDIFDRPDDAYRAMTEIIAAFEKTDFFAPFDSRYDRYLRAASTR